MNTEKIIAEVIDNYLKKNAMLKEYRNPKDSETIRVCADQLDNLYNTIISNGASKNEYTVEQLHKIVSELRKLEGMFR